MALIQRTRGAVREELERFGQGEDRYGLIHCDFLPENLLCGEGGIRLIDFDDAGFGWHLFDIATSLFFLTLMGDGNADAIENAFVEGYRSQRDLPDSHLAMLPAFLLLRGLVYLGWAHTRPETETARELTPLLIKGVTAMAADYLERLGSAKTNESDPNRRRCDRCPMWSARGRTLSHAPDNIAADWRCKADIRGGASCGRFAGISYASLCIVRQLAATDASVTN